MMKKIMCALMCVLMCVGLASMASGELLITNGDFEADAIGGGQDFADVAGWYESDAGAFWDKPWFKEAGDGFNGTGLVVFSGAVAGPEIDGAGLLGYVYQNIGTADGAAVAKIAFQSAGPNGDAGSDYGITVTILESDGSFVPDGEVDVLGAAGMTVIDQQTQFYTAGAAVNDGVLTLDLLSVDAADGDLYLRINHYGGGFIGFDNVTLVPVYGVRGPSPKHRSTVGMAEDLTLSWTNWDPNDPADDVYVDVWWGTEPNALAPGGLDFNKIITAGTNVDFKDVDSSAIDTYYWRVDSYIGGVVDELNRIEGPLWSYTTSSDVAPAVAIETLDQMTWSGEGVPLDATVTDDDVSEVTIEWTADLPDGITASFDPGNDVADPTITLTKVKTIITDAVFVNPSFEMVEAQSDITTTRDTWGHYDRPPGTGYALMYVPNTTYHFPEDENTPPDGNIICRTATAVGQSRPDGLATILNANFDPSRTYTLTVAVGHPHAVPDNPAYSDATWRGYIVQLVAGGEVESNGSGADNISGGTVIAEDDNGLTIARRTWETSTVTYTAGSGFAELAGQPLQIRLLAKDDPDPAYPSQTKVFYDNVTLTADPDFAPVYADAPTGIQTVTVTVAVTDEYNSPATDTASIEIDVYDDACQIAKVAQGKSAITDFDANCITNLADFAVLAMSWIDDYSSTGPADRE